MIETLKRRLFWIVARTCFTLYHWFPLFGLLRASIGIIRQGETFLVIQRNDGRGLSLPGGIAGWKETEEETLRREVLEETGLNVTSQELRMRYESRTDVPCTISVFEVEASGELKNSWEGAPRWITVAELDRYLLRSQRPVIELLTKISAQAHQEGSTLQDQ
jgi:8-oxo-dGTP pyrophosphatase MutT (NUDIX family)